MKSDQTLLFFTLQYPYGKKSETFIENEIGILSKSFKKVIIFPREYDSDGIRNLPENVEVNDLLIKAEKVRSHFAFMFSSFLRFIETIRIYLYTIFFDKKRLHYFKNGYFLYYLANAIRDADLLQGYIRENGFKNEIYYDYWFVNSTLSLAILKSRKQIRSFSCRAHGFDVFDDRWDSGSVPFRQYIMKQVSKVYTISQYNKRYISKQLLSGKKKVMVSYLGVKKHDKLLQPGTLKGNQFLLVSCANLFPFKQVDLIAKVLQRISNKDALIKWVHFGDGPAEKEVFLASKDLPSHIEFDYRGHVSNSEVIDFYKKHLVDLFISLSLKEGLPVSMMEAQSFGIPVLAFDIYGIPELVNEQTGILMDSASNAIDISQEIDQLISGRKEFDQNKIRQHFTEHFHAQKNYETFVLNLLATK